MRITCLELRIVEVSECKADWSEQHNRLCAGSGWAFLRTKSIQMGCVIIYGKGSTHTKPGVKETDPGALYSQLTCLLK